MGVTKLTPQLRPGNSQQVGKFNWHRTSVHPPRWWCRDRQTHRFCLMLWFSQVT